MRYITLLVAAILLGIAGVSGSAGAASDPLDAFFDEPEQQAIRFVCSDVESDTGLANCILRAYQITTTARWPGMEFRELFFGFTDDTSYSYFRMDCAERLFQFKSVSLALGRIGIAIPEKTCEDLGMMLAAWTGIAPTFVHCDAEAPYSYEVLAACLGPQSQERRHKARMRLFAAIYDDGKWVVESLGVLARMHDAIVSEYQNEHRAALRAEYEQCRNGQPPTGTIAKAFGHARSDHLPQFPRQPAYKEAVQSVTCADLSRYVEEAGLLRDPAFIPDRTLVERVRGDLDRIFPEQAREFEAARKHNDATNRFLAAAGMVLLYAIINAPAEEWGKGASTGSTTRPGCEGSYDAWAASGFDLDAGAGIAFAGCGPFSN